MWCLSQHTINHKMQINFKDQKTTLPNFKDLQDYFIYPLEKAASYIGICTTMLKR